MNRAILVVMCDFIVVSMLSMITGLSTLENPYGDDGAVVNSRTANVIIEELRAQRLAIEESLKELEETQKRFGHSQARESAIKQLEIKRAKAQMQLELLQTKDFTGIDVSEKNKLTITQADLNTRYKNAMNKLNKIENKDELEKFSFGGSGNGSGTGDKIAGYTTKEDANINSEENRKIKEKLAKSEVDLEHTKDELRRLEAKLAQFDNEKAELNQQIGNYKQKITQIGEKLSSTEDKLQTTQRQLVYTKREIIHRESAIKTQKNQISSTQNVVKKAVTDLSKAKKEIIQKEQVISNKDKVIISKENEINQVKENAKKVEEDLNFEISEATNRLQHMKKSLGSDVLTTYKNTFKNITIKNEQKRMFLDYKNGGNYFLPVIKINHKPVVISLFSILSGNSLNDAEFKNVYNLEYKLHDPNDKNIDIQNITGPLFISRKDMRIALLEIPDAPDETLHFLDVSTVRERGFHDMYLFKFNEFGKDGGTLNGRCSMSLSDTDNYLYIKNNSQAKDMAVTAEIGDMVMTREGGFVGVVVDVTKLDNGKSEAKCFIFPDNFELEDSIKLSIKRERKEEFFTNYSKLGATIWNRIQKMKEQ